MSTRPTRRRTHAPKGPLVAWTNTQLKRELAELNRLLATARAADGPTVVIVHRMPAGWRARPGQRAVRRLPMLAGRYIASVPERQAAVVAYPREALAFWASWRHDLLVDELRARKGLPRRWADVEDELRARLTEAERAAWEAWMAKQRAENERREAAEGAAA